MGHLNNVPVAYTVKNEAYFHYLPLTPGHFLMGSAYTELKPIDTESTKLTNATRYNRVCSVLELFWNRERYYTIGKDHPGPHGNGWGDWTSGVLRRLQVLRSGNNERSGAAESGRTISKQTSNSKQNEQEGRASSSLQNKKHVLEREYITL
jgi:hypothetical protein